MESLPTPQSFTSILSPAEEALNYVAERMVAGTKVRVGDSYGWTFGDIGKTFDLSAGHKSEINKQLTAVGWRVEWRGYSKTTLCVLMPHRKLVAVTNIPPPADIRF
jgi:hypothetical protein